MTDLRKVKFSIKQFDGTIMDFETGGENAGEICKERDGLFHQWGSECWYSNTVGDYLTCTIAIVEEEATGKVYHVIPKFMKFVK